MKKVKRYSKLKMFGLYMLSLFVNLLPLAIVVMVYWEDCTKTTRESVALTVTGVFWVLFLVITLIGAMPKNINRAFTLVLIFVVLELMKPLLAYMCIFAGASAIGALLDSIIIRPIIVRYVELRQATKTADITTNQVKEAVAELLEERSGRV